MDDAQKAMFDRIMASPRGGVRGPYPALMRHPELARVQELYGHHVRYNNALPERLKELAILVTARHWSAQYEWYAHRSLAEKQGVSPAVCDTIARGETPSGLDEAERAIYAFTSMLLKTRAVDDATFAGVKDRFGDKGVLDNGGIVGYYTLVAIELNTARYALPAGGQPLPRLPR